MPYGVNIKVKNLVGCHFSAMRAWRYIICSQGRGTQSLDYRIDTGENKVLIIAVLNCHNYWGHIELKVPREATKFSKFN